MERFPDPRLSGSLPIWAASFLRKVPSSPRKVSVPPPPRYLVAGRGFFCEPVAPATCPHCWASRQNNNEKKKPLVLPKGRH
jgi:hypothetical protein